MMPDELAEHLDALARDDCYRVDAVLKDGAFETTQRVYFVGANGAEQGPYVRKYLDGDAGFGAAYERIWNAQRAGRRFLHLPRIIECYAAGEQRAVVMEHVQGETLDDAVYRCDPSVELACDVFPRLCEAVSELHEGFDPPIIHRDLKPSNVMLSHDNLTIIDFGISRTFDADAEEDTRHFGTRAYAPPEQFGYGQTDARSDVYALGMLLYFCLTEKTPDAKARHAGYASPQVPEALRPVIVRATAFDPDARYESVAELRLAFDEAIGRRAEVSAPVSTSVPVPEPIAAPALASAAPPPAFAVQPGTLTGRTVYANSAPGSAGTERARRSSRARSSASSSVPHAFGIVWDAVLALIFVLFLVVVTGMVFAPSPDQTGAAAPLWLRAFSYYSLLMLMFAPVFYLVSDRRPLRKLVPALERCTLKRELVVCGALMLVGFFAVGISAQFFPVA